jgi:hypothetical protein
VSYGRGGDLGVPIGGTQKRSLRIVRTRAGHGLVRGTKRWIRVRFDEHNELYVMDSEEEEKAQLAATGDKQDSASAAEVHLVAAIGDEPDAVFAEVECDVVGDEQAAGAAAEVEGAAVAEEQATVAVEMQDATLQRISHEACHRKYNCCLHQILVLQQRIKPKPYQLHSYSALFYVDLLSLEACKSSWLSW